MGDASTVFEQSIQDLDVKKIFATIFDENYNPVQPEDLQENSAITDLREAANLGVNFEFEHFATMTNGKQLRLVIMSDGSGSFSAYAEDMDDYAGPTDGTYSFGQMEGDGDEQIDSDDGTPNIIEGVEEIIPGMMFEQMEDG